jgi:hypothetical protein
VAEQMQLTLAKALAMSNITAAVTICLCASDPVDFPERPGVVTSHVSGLSGRKVKVGIGDNIDCLHQANQPESLDVARGADAIKGDLSKEEEDADGTLNNGYIRKVPLPQVPREQSTNHVACTFGKSKRNAFTDLWGVYKMCLLTDTVNPHTTVYLPDPRIPVYDNLKRLSLDVSKIVLAPSSPCWLM